MRDIASFKLDSAGSRIHKPNNCSRQSCLPGAAFSDKPKRLSLRNLKTHIVNRPNEIPTGPEKPVLNRKINL
jgi:hypothetical protein